MRNPSTTGCSRHMPPAAGGMPQWLRAARGMGAAIATASAWLLLLVTVVPVVVGVLVDRYATLDESVIQYAIYATMWFPSALAIIITATGLTLHVAGGMTRRSFVRAALAVAVVTALVYGLVTTGLLLAEGALYDALGLVHGSSGTSSSGEVVRGLWERGFLPAWGAYSLVTAAGVVGGLLVGAGYYRFGWLRGTLFVAVGILPVLLVQLLPDIDSPQSLLHRAGIHPAWYLALVALTVVGGAALFAALLRRVAIGGVES